MTDTQESCMAISKLLQGIVPKYAKATGRQFSSQGITSSQAEILVSLEEHGPQKVSELAGSLGMAESNVSNICSRLEKTGLLKRQRRTDDRRVVMIELDESAYAVIADIKQEMSGFHEKMQASFSTQEITEICESLTKLNLLLDSFLNSGTVSTRDEAS